MQAPVSPFAQTEPIPVGDFHLLGLLGEGGTGTVYAARHRGGDVALKVLRPALALSERECSRFLDEAVRMRRVEHEGLVRLLGSGVLADGRPYLCMPRLRGETLARRLERGKLELPEALAIFDTLAQAVGVVHRAGLIHRDIKPENVFLEEPSEGEAWPHPILLDFGIARDVTEEPSTTTAAGQTRGTPAYMAPERFFGARATVRTDVYELAVTLYAMLTARVPWNDAQCAAARLSPIHPADTGVALPAELSTVILRALSTRPEMRPESADSFAELVRRASASSSSASRTTAEIPTVPRRGRDRGGVGGSVARAPWRAPRRVIALLGAALVLVTAGLFARARGHQPPPSAPVSSVPVSAPPAEAIADPPEKPAPRGSVEVSSSPAPEAPLSTPPMRRAWPATNAAGSPPMPASPASSASSASSPTSRAESPDRYYRDRK
jgi:serine/threonine protein kinase